ncbi:hypothetical protein ABPG75_010144 [Micractinium tetrahymenae]
MRALVAQAKAAPASLLARLRAAASLLGSSEAAPSPAASYSSSAAPATSAVAALDEGGAEAATGPAAAGGSSASASPSSTTGGSSVGDLNDRLLRDVLQWRHRSLHLQDIAAIELAINGGDAGLVTAAAAESAGGHASAAGPPSVPNLEARRAQLSAAIRAAPSCARVGRLLLGRRHTLTSVHLEQALARMGQLVREARRPPDEEEQEVFLGAREVLFGMLEQEGRQLSLGAACHLLCASTWMRLPLSREQQEAVEAVALPALPTASATHVQELLSSYLRLGMRPGQALAAWVAPPVCAASPHAAQSERVAAALAAPQAAAAAQRRQPRHPRPKQLSPEALVRELSRAARMGQHTYLLRLLLHHAEQLNSVHLFLALEALAQEPPQSSSRAAGGPAAAAAAAAGPAAAAAAAAAAGPAAAAAAAGDPAAAVAAAQRPRRPRRQPVLVDTFRSMREVALEVVFGEQMDGEAALSAACSLLRTSAAMRQPLGPGEQAVPEALAVAGLAEATCGDLEVLVLAYDELGLQAGSELQEAAAAAAERLLPAANARQLRAILPAWQRCGWPVTHGMASAAELAALTCLHNAVSTIMIGSDDADSSSSGSRSGSSSGGGGGRTSSSASSSSSSSEEVYGPGDPWRGVTPQGRQNLTSLARVAARLCEAFALAEWPLGPALTDDLRVTLPFCVPAVKLGLSGRLLACCLRLGLLPDPGLAAAFLQGAARQLQAAAPEDAAGFVARLLAALALQGWRCEAAPPEQQQAAQLAVSKLAEWLEALHTARRHRSFQARCWDIRGELGRLCRWLHALAAVGLRPPEPTLRSACSYLRHHKRALWRKERQWLAEAFAEWGVTDHGLGALASGSGSSGGGNASSRGGSDGGSSGSRSEGEGGTTDAQLQQQL